MIDEKVITNITNNYNVSTKAEFSLQNMTVTGLRCVLVLACCCLALTQLAAALPPPLQDYDGEYHGKLVYKYPPRKKKSDTLNACITGESRTEPAEPHDSLKDLCNYDPLKACSTWNLSG